MLFDCFKCFVSYLVCHVIFFSNIGTITAATTATISDSCESQDVQFLSDDLPIVVINYQDLLDKSNLQSSIATAYGVSGLGILLVSNVPNLEFKRERLLKLSRMFAHDLPTQYKNNLINKDSFYSIGWSHGVEKLAKGKPDLRKASFYGNPIYDDPTNGNQKLIKSFPAFYYPNIWPGSTEHSNLIENNEQIETTIMSSNNGDDENRNDSLIINEIGMSIDEFGIELREAFMSLGGLIYRVGTMLSETMDDYVESVRKNTSYQANTLSNAIKTKHPKARLLYYFSENEYQTIMNSNQNIIENVETTENNENLSENDEKQREDSWCGWHNDHSALTGLALGMYFDEDGNIVETLENSVAGLNIKTRSNKTYHLHFDNNEASKYLAFQIGETSQILSGGALYATPHSVHGPSESEHNNIARASMAVFMQPSHDHHMRAPSNLNITMVQFDRNLPENVPTLGSRWENATGDTFGDFSQRTFETYY